MGRYFEGKLLFVDITHILYSVDSVYRRSHASKDHLRSVDPQNNCRNYVSIITHSILKFPTPLRSSLQRRSFDIYIYIYIYISVVDPKNKELAVYHKCSMAYCTHVLRSILRLRATSGGQLNTNRG